MEWLNWSPFYDKVAEELKLDSAKDYEVALKFRQLLEEHNSQGYESIIKQVKNFKKDKVWIFGAGPSLEKDFQIFVNNYSKSTDLLVGVDGACLFLEEQGYSPDIIFSDLDGSVTAIENLLEKGSILILHAHGDNFPLVKKAFSRLQKYSLLGTVQTEPDEPFLYNFGGFTDGDRAIAATLTWYASVKVILLGFTFGTIQGKYSKPEKLQDHAEASEFKLKKLTFAKEFIKTLAEIYPGQIINLSKPTEHIQGVSETLTNNS